MNIGASLGRTSVTLMAAAAMAIVVVPAPAAADCQGGVVWPSLDRARGTTFVGVFEASTTAEDGGVTHHWTVERVLAGPLRPGPLHGWGIGAGCHATGYREGRRYLVSSRYPGGASAFDTVAYELLGRGRVRLAPFPEQPRWTAPRRYRVDTIREALRLLVPKAAARAAASAGGPRPPFSIARDRDDLFLLTVATDSARVLADRPIAIRTSLRYLGDEQATVSGPYGGLVAFGVEQLDGPVDIGPGWRPSCDLYRFRPGALREIPFATWAGGADPEGSTDATGRSLPDAPVVRLPAGRYVITAYAHHAGLGEVCFRHRPSTLSASIAVEVVGVPSAAPVAQPSIRSAVFPAKRSQRARMTSQYTGSISSP